MITNNRNHRPFHRILLSSVILTLLLALTLTGAASAVEFTHDGNVPAGTTIDDDLFISADKITVDGTVNGDLFLNSNQAVVNGTVNGNLIVNSALLTINGVVNGSLIYAGQSAQIQGEINGTMYSAGASVHLLAGSHIQRNLFFAGMSLQTDPESVIGRDLATTGYQLIHKGLIGRDAAVEMSAVEIEGSVGRNVTAIVDEPETTTEPNFFLLFFEGTDAPPIILPGLRVQASAQIGGKLTYTSPIEQSSAILSAPGGGIEFTQKQPQVGKTQVSLQKQTSLWFLARVRELITLLILGSLVVLFAPGALRQASKQLGERPLHSFGWGFVCLIGGLAIALVSVFIILIVGILLTVVSLGALSQAVFGMGFSGLGFAFAAFMLLVNQGSKLVVAYMVGKWLLARFSPAYAEHRWWPLIVGVVIYVMLAGIPIAGWLVSLVAILSGLGAIWLLYYHRGKQPAEMGLPAVDH
ncbi:MAG: polymer-forming cytoskeletal protein [Anaerolineales bacterium]|nr:polymer-forming cytoskeletal protein [Anaerolineales bacterium]